VIGMIAILFSAVVYAMNLVVARHQAQLAKPLEIAFFQNCSRSGCLRWRRRGGLPCRRRSTGRDRRGGPARDRLAAAAVLGLCPRRGAGAAPVEYTAFIWASLMGWWMFGEKRDASLLSPAPY
jgi:hypothetical protein